MIVFQWSTVGYRRPLLAQPSPQKTRLIEYNYNFEIRSRPNRKSYRKIEQKCKFLAQNLSFYVLFTFLDSVLVLCGALSYAAKLGPFSKSYF